MKRSLIIMGILAVSFVLILSFFFLNTSKCTAKNPENCDSTCSTDDDCIFQCGCGCLNKKKFCSGSEVIDCVGFACECRLNKCERVIECSIDSDCQDIDCSKYGIPGVKEGYKPYCVDDICKCMCYGCL